MAWWNPSYPLRRKLTIEAISEDLPMGQEVVFELPIDEFVAQDKVRSDFEDIEVVHVDELDNYTVLGRMVTPTTVSFALLEDIPLGETVEDTYRIYYGNQDLSEAPFRPPYAPDLWPTTAPYWSPSVSYTRPGEHWYEGVSSTRGAKSTFKFSGTAVRYVATKGPDAGIVDVYLDSVFEGKVDLFSPVEVTESVYESAILTSGPHKLQLLVTGDKTEGSGSNTVNITEFNFIPQYASQEDGEEYLPEEWASYTGGIS